MKLGDGVAGGDLKSATTLVSLRTLAIRETFLGKRTLKWEPAGKTGTDAFDPTGLWGYVGTGLQGPGRGRSGVRSPEARSNEVPRDDESSSETKHSETKMKKQNRKEGRGEGGLDFRNTIAI